MDQVEQDRAPAKVPPPAVAYVEVVVGLVEHGRADDGDQGPEASALDDRAGLRHHRAVVAVMAGEDGHPGRLTRLDQPGRVLDRVGDRLLDDHRDAGGDAGQAALGVQPVRRRQDDAVGLLAREQLVERRVQADAVPCGQHLAVGAGLDDGVDPGVRAAVDLLEMPLADQAAADDGDVDGFHARLCLGGPPGQASSWAITNSSARV